MRNDPLKDKVVVVDRELYENTLADLTELLATLPRCGEKGCVKAATRAHPTAVIGDYIRRCDEHPGALGNEFDDVAYDLKWADVIRRHS